MKNGHDVTGISARMAAAWRRGVAVTAGGTLHRGDSQQLRKGRHQAP